MVGTSKKARKTYLRMVQSVQISRQPPKATRLNNLAIGFPKEDAKKLHHPHDDTLVIN